MIVRLTSGIDVQGVGIAFHFNDEYGEFVGSCYARTVLCEYLKCNDVHRKRLTLLPS